MDITFINIKGLNKGQLLEAMVLGTQYNGQQFVFATEFRSYFSPIIDDPEKIAMAGRVDYYKNKPIKTDLRYDFVDPCLYDRDAGSGTFAKIVHMMRITEANMGNL